MSNSLSRTVLYLEDDHKLLGDQASALKKRGLAVKAAKTIDEAERVIKAGDLPGAFLFDLELRRDRIDGFEFAEELRVKFNIDAERFVFLTSWSERFNAPAAFSMSAIFTKPASTNEITEQLKLILDGGEG